MLIESEITHFARGQKPNAMTLSQILQQRDSKAFASFIHNELPIRWAGRIRLIESLPHWGDCAHLRSIRDLYKDCFLRLRMIPTQQDQQNVKKLRTELKTIKKRTAAVLHKVITGVRQAKIDGIMSDRGADEFLNAFLTSRIGSEILSSQYIALTNPLSSGNDTVVDPDCNPEEICREMADDTAELCSYHYGYAPPIIVQTTNQSRALTFPFIRQYLEYIMFELLKNSLRAVVETWNDECEQKPVAVMISGDDQSIVIRVSDAGGGIPLDKTRNVWSYLYTTAKQQSVSADAHKADDDDSVAPMAGFGCGLPLSRSYANYVGGRLAISSMPHYGTDVYLYLNRLGDDSETVLEGYSLTSMSDATSLPVSFSSSVDHMWREGGQNW